MNLYTFKKTRALVLGQDILCIEVDGKPFNADGSPADQGIRHLCESVQVNPERTRGRIPEGVFQVMMAVYKANPVARKPRPAKKVSPKRSPKKQRRVDPFEENVSQVIKGIEGASMSSRRGSIEIRMPVQHQGKDAMAAFSIKSGGTSYQALEPGLRNKTRAGIGFRKLTQALEQLAYDSRGMGDDDFQVFAQSVDYELSKGGK